MMDINIKFKLRSLLRRKQNFHCLSYDWDTRQINIHKFEHEYQAQITNLRKNGLIKRAECYHDELFITDHNQVYLIYLISFGDFRKAKMVRGENPIAKGLGVCMFDYVYLFIQQFHQAQKKMEARIEQLDRRGEYFHRNLMMEIHYKLFKDKQETSFSTHNISAQCMNKEEGKEESFSV